MTTTPTPTSGAADLPEALINIAREIEALKRDCGMDPESAIAIQNGRYMAISYKARALAAGQATAAQAQPAPENIRGILARCRDFIDTTKAPAYPAGADLADEIDVLLAAPPPSHAAQAVVPAGWNLVPTEPTQAMLDAVVTSMDDFLLGKEAEKQYREDWAAMLAAAPAQPVAEPAGAVSEMVKFTDQSTANPIEKARRYLAHVANKKPNNPYLFDDGYPRESIADDAAAALSVLEQLAASHGQAPATAQADSVQEDAMRYRWLRDQPFDEWKRIAWHVSGRSPTIYADRDAAIDIARKQGGA
jgi:hypothetical protein